MRRPAPLLWLLFALFVLRVLGQLAVVVFHPPFLPPMEEWFSGLLPYPALLASQILIIALLLKINIDFTRGSGYWTRPHRRLGVALIWFGSLYLGAMIIRLFWQDGGLIPTLFHWVLATYVLVVGRSHLQRTKEARVEFK